jgi:MFS transporter, DHA1 family, tetracycline resistance protein
LAAAFLQLVTLVLTITMLPESRSRTDGEEKVGLNDVLASFRRPKLARILWQKLAISLGLYGWFAVFALYLQRQLGFSLPQTDYLFSGFAAFNVFCNAVLVGRVSTNIGDRAMSNVGLALLVTGFALVPFVHAVTLLAAVMIVFSCGMAFTNTGITALISNAASDREQGTVLGTSSSLDSLSGIIAPPVSTGLLAAYGPRFAGTESIAMAFVALLMGLAQARGEPGASALKEAPQ